MAESGLLLLNTGRAGMAQKLLEGLPAAIRAKQQEACQQLEVRLVELRVELQRLKAEQRDLKARITRQRAELGTTVARKRPSPSPRPHQLLAAPLAAGRVTAEAVAEVLGVRAEDVPPIAAGRVGLAPTAWRRLVAILEAAA